MWGRLTVTALHAKACPTCRPSPKPYGVLDYFRDEFGTWRAFLGAVAGVLVGLVVVWVALVLVLGMGRYA